MKQNLKRTLVIAAFGGLITAFANAGAIPAGFVSVDIGIDPNNGMPTYEFDVTNLTGANSAAPDFPVVTQESMASPGVIFNNLSLQITFLDGSMTNLGSAYFSPAGDGLSFFGSMEDFNAANPLTQAILTGTFDTTAWTLFDSSTSTVLPGFAATIGDPGGPLLDQDLAVINGTGTIVSSGTPEPSTWFLSFSALAVAAALPYFRRQKIQTGGMQ